MVETSFCNPLLFEEIKNTSPNPKTQIEFLPSYLL